MGTAGEAPGVQNGPATVVLVGNPNTGKSTLFSALVGVSQRVGNYPGVTVEKKLGQTTVDGAKWTVVDLPGTYSLAPRSLDEMVAVDVLLGRQSDVGKPDVVLCVVDATNLERNLYLVSQALELGLPTVIALTMTDLADRKGIALDLATLRDRLGVEVVPVQGHKKVGLDDLKRALSRARTRPSAPPESPFPSAFRAEVERLECLLAPTGAQPRYLVERLLLDQAGYVESHLLVGPRESLKAELVASRDRLKSAGCPVPAVEAMARYGWVGRVVDGLVQRSDSPRTTWSDRVDAVVTHKVYGTVFLAALLLLIFNAVFSWATLPMDAIDEAAGALGKWVESKMSGGALRSLIVDGIIGGIGGVIVFLPQILILFFFLAILEDCGYLARAAYLMDRLMVRVGLSGKSFIPLLSSFACAIPGIMATRVIENRRDRLTTILVAPLMSCSARLPVYILLTAAFIPRRDFLGGVVGLQGLTMFSMYLVGILAAAGMAFVFKRTLLKGAAPPFVMELPAYRWPSIRVVAWRMIDRGWSFLQGAGTIILAVSILMWALLYYPRLGAGEEAAHKAEVAAIEAKIQALPETKDQEPARAELDELLAKAESRLSGAQKRQSWLGRAGRWIEPAVRPLGWDWRIGCAVLASFPAREVVVATLGVIYDVGEEGGEDHGEGGETRLQTALKSARWDQTNRPVFNVPVALSIMVFFALCAQCVSTLVVIRKETNSWSWPALCFAYMTALAYVGALLTYQVGAMFL